MAKNDVEKVTEEKIRAGGVLVKFYFDMQNEDKEKLQPLMVALINDNLMKEPGVVYVYGSVEDPLEKDGIYITSATVTALFDSFLPLLSVVFRYAPAALEITKPEKEMHFKTSELQSMLMDMSSLSIGYSKFILEKVLKPEEIEAFKKQMDNRAEMGKKLLEKKKVPDEKGQE